ncbi:MAG: hypothetical protein ACRETL_07230, partial [Gammaproteobacteria bacterium]
MTSSRTGGDFLSRKNLAVQLGRKLPKLDSILIVEDDASDRDRLRATLRIILGYDPNARSAATLGSALDLVLSAKPDLVFLDDLLKPAETALHSIPFLRRAGYEGPI